MILRYIILYVGDVAAALAFYERAFGLERGFLQDSGDYGELATGATTLAFSSTTLMRQLGKAPGRPSPAAPGRRITSTSRQPSGRTTARPAPAARWRHW